MRPLKLAGNAADRSHRLARLFASLKGYETEQAFRPVHAEVVCEGPQPLERATKLACIGVGPGRLIIRFGALRLHNLPEAWEVTF